VCAFAETQFAQVYQASFFDDASSRCRRPRVARACFPVASAGGFMSLLQCSRLVSYPRARGRFTVMD